MRVVVVVNDAAGPASRRRRATPSAAQLEAAFRSHDVTATVQFASDERMTGTAQAARDTRPDAVIAAGGDGSIGAVAGALAGTAVPLGVLPLGTFNHFAKDVGIPLDLRAAVACIAAGHLRRIDVGEVNGRVFVNNASIGAYPQMVLRREEQRSRLGLPKHLATFLATLEVLRKWPLLQVRVEAEDTVLQRTTPFVFVGNNAYAVDLFRIGLRPSLEGGRLSLYTANCPRLGTLLRLVWHALGGALDQARDFEARSVERVRVHLRRKSVRVALDGEVTPLQTPLQFRIRPRDLLVLTPA